MASEASDHRSAIEAEWDAAWLGIISGSVDAATRNPAAPMDAIGEFLAALPGARVIAGRIQPAGADDDPICLCDAYRADLRPGRCRVHGRA